MVNEIGTNRKPTKAQREQDKRDQDFAAQEMARIRGTSSTTSRSTASRRPVAVSFGGRRSSLENPRKHVASGDIDTTAGRKSATPPRPISYRKTPSGPNPIRMWREK